MSFQQGLSGLDAASKNLDVIGNNVSNSNTIGFKGSKATFADVFASSVGGGGTSIGIGTSIAAVTTLFGQGSINVSSNPLDLAINGTGFFRVSENGAVSYTRNGQLQLDKDGYVTSSDGGRLSGYAADAAGQIVASTPADLQVSRADVPPQVTSNTKVNTNLDSRSGTLPAAGFNAGDPATYHGATSMSVFDSLGNPHSLSLYFVKTAANAWSVFGANDGTQIGAGAIGVLNFTGAGAIDTGTTTLPFSVAAPVTSGATSPMSFNVDFTGSTQFGSSFGVNELTQDGYASGRLSGFTISSDGVLLGRYTNGESRAQGQIVLANFNNPQGLTPLGGSRFGETSASGQPVIGAPGSANLGAIQSGALEESNVDLTAELVQMIIAQRVYQANAQSIKTQDSVLQTLVNLR